MLKVDYLRSYENKSDSFLINAIKSGDNDAFSELINRCSGIIDYNLSSFAVRLFRPNCLGDNTERDDLFQECCIILFKAAKRYNLDFDVKFSTYANVCIKNYLISLCRKYTKNKNNGYITVSLDDGSVAHKLNMGYAVYANSYDLYGASDSAEIIDAKALLSESELTDFEREVCILYLQDESYKNIAKVLGKNVKSVDNAVCRIKSKLKKLKQPNAKK